MVGRAYDGGFEEDFVVETVLGASIVCALGGLDAQPLVVEDEAAGAKVGVALGSVGPADAISVLAAGDTLTPRPPDFAETGVAQAVFVAELPDLPALAVRAVLLEGELLLVGEVVLAGDVDLVREVRGLRLALSK